MKKKMNLSSLININTPVTDNNLNLSHDEIMSLLENQNFIEQYDINFYKYMNYLGNISGIHNIGAYFKFMNIDINEKTQDSIITFSPSGLIISLAIMLNSLKNEGEIISYKEIEDSINKLQKVKDENELASKYPMLYRDVFLVEKQDGEKWKNLLHVYESTKNDKRKL